RPGERQRIPSPSPHLQKARCESPSKRRFGVPASCTIPRTSEPSAWRCVSSPSTKSRARRVPTMSTAETARSILRNVAERSRRVPFHWALVALFTALTTFLFWRYALHPATTISDPGDPFLLIWIMEWVERAILHSPLSLFDAPMFHPFRDTLAYSDLVLPQA